MKRYTADFETTTDIEDCRVWAYATCELSNVDNVQIGNSIEDFIEWCKEENKIVYFHNLKFDGEFIIHWLLHHGYKYSKDKQDMTFSTVISSMNVFYAIEIIFEKKNKKYKKVTIYDSLKKLPYPVAKIAKDFHLPIQKLEIDYKAYREVGHVLTDEEIDYITNDVKIVAMALQIQIEQGLTKMTNGSDALSSFTEMVGKNTFKSIFPVLDIETDSYIRDSYKGGWTYVNKMYQNIDIGWGSVFDVNSLYPSRMYDCDLPCGFPEFFEGQYVYDEEMPLYIQHIGCEFKLKKDHLPMIQIKGSFRFKETEYLECSDGYVELKLCNVDLDLFFDQYEVTNIEYLGGCKFKKCKGVFKEYIDHWTEIKINNEGAIRSNAKLMLNSLYGKFATNPDVTGKHPYLKDDDTVGYELNEKELREPVYTAMGVFITAWGRDMTIRTAQKCYHRFGYADTDSIHIVGTEIPNEIKDLIDDKKLGYWAHESTFTRARWVRQKTYIEEVEVTEEKYKEEANYYKRDGKYYHLEVKCAGMPDKVKEKVTWDNFHVGFKEWGKLRPKHVKGGIVLEDGTFEMK